MVLYSSSSAPCMHQQVLSKHAQKTLASVSVSRRGHGHLRTKL